MFRRLTAGLAAASLVFTAALPSPAGAMSDRDRQLLTILLGAAAIGIVINESKKKREDTPMPVVSRRDEDDHHRSWYDWKSDHDDRWRFRTIPAQCVFPIRGPRGPSEVVSARCLTELGLRRDLPAECAFEVEAGWGSRTVYGSSCLRQSGYRISEAR